MPTCLDGLIVLELGKRTAVSLCGSLLAQLGATVILAEPAGATTTDEPKSPTLVAGKLRISIDKTKREDLALLSSTAERADLLLVSSDDVDSLLSYLDNGSLGDAVICDISAFGSTGPLSGLAHADVMVQALSGLIETTGNPKEPPIPIGLPMAEFLAAINGASGALSALRLRQANGVGYGVEVALFDSAFESTSTFLARALAGQSPTRVGNRHPNVSPFNAYRTRDGSINLCTGNDEHWRKMCAVMGRDDVLADDRFTTMSKRAAAMDAVDSIVEGWTSSQSSEDCINTFLNVGIPTGPITPVADIPTDLDLRGRGVVQDLLDPVTHTLVSVPGSVFAFSEAKVQRPTRISAPDEDRAAVAAIGLTPKQKYRAPARPPQGAPLSGVLVVEIGQYTTGPRGARHLAALGAEVIKVEMPPNGDPARTYAPFVDGQSYFFHLNNSGKQSVVLELKSAEGAADLRKILAKADVLIENLKPGALSKLGFAAKDVLKLNPRLIYCSVSGYGTESIYNGRPGMDSVIQGMAGIPDVTRSNGVPYKGGISVSDVVGGQLSVVAILSALEFRERTGRGQFIDVSMFDGSVWLTQLAWNAGSRPQIEQVHILKCSDGFVAAIATDAVAKAEQAKPLVSRTELVRRLEAQNIACAPILALAESLVHPQTIARGLIANGVAPDRSSWPHVASPIRISGASAVKLRAAGRLYDHHGALATRFGLATGGRVLNEGALV